MDLLELAKNHKPVVLETALGELGLRLKKFADAIDHNHPDIPRMLGGIFHAANETNWAMSQLISLADFVLANKHDYKQVLPLLTKMKSGLEFPTDFIKLIDEPNEIFIRLLPSIKSRRQLRSFKRSYPVDLKAFYKKGEVEWNACPSGFKMYCRFDQSYKAELEKIQSLIDLHERLGSGKELLDEIKVPAENFKNLMEDVYYGFHRIKLTTASVVLAKQHRYEFAKVYGTAGLIKAAEDTYYFPCVYPYADLISVLNRRKSNFAKEIEHLEATYPTFDHYLLLVPGVTYSRESLFIPTVTNDKIERDKALIEQGVLSPVLLGERDGKCYFISE